MEQPKTTGRLLETAERRSFVLRLRRAGATYEDIARQARSQFGPARLPKGWDERYAYKDVRRELDRVREEMAEDAQAVRTLELQRLDRLFMTMFSRAIDGDEGAVDRCLRIMKRRADLLGLDEPKRQDIHVTTWQDTVVEKLRTGELTPDEVRAAWPDLAAEFFAKAGVRADASD